MKTIKELLSFLMEYLMDDKYLVVMKAIGNRPVTSEQIEQKTGFSQGLIRRYINGKKYKFFEKGNRVTFKKVYRNVPEGAVDPGKHTGKIGLLELGLIECDNCKYRLSDLGKEFLKFIK